MNDKPHCMIDFETLGTNPSTNVFSLGLVLFNKNGIYQSEEYFFEYDQRRTMTFDTVHWWSKQTGFSLLLDKVKAKGKKSWNILDEITKVLPPKYYIWGNGANFDPVILESLFHQNGFKTPWPFWDVRCYRTLKALFPDIEKGLVNNSKHDALEDAKFQANAVINFLKMGYVYGSPAPGAGGGGGSGTP